MKVGLKRWWDRAPILSGFEAVVWCIKARRDRDGIAPQFCQVLRQWYIKLGLRPWWDRAPILSGFEAVVYESRTEAVVGSGPNSVRF